MTFTLLGHDSPTGEYPAPVVPVGKRNGVLCVRWRTEAGVEFETVRPDAEFVRHTLEDFDAADDALFAFQPDDVVSYPIADEAVFLDAVLQAPRMTDADPFFRLGLAIETGHEDLISAELLRARRRMVENAPDYTDQWYTETLARLGPEWIARTEELLAHDATSLPASARAVLAGLSLAERAFDRQAARLRDVLARSSGNGKAEQLEHLRSRISSDVTLLALGGRQARDLILEVRVPGTRIEWVDRDKDPLNSREVMLLQKLVPVSDVVMFFEDSASSPVAAMSNLHALSAIDVPKLVVDVQWLRSGASKVAELEHGIARIARDRVRLPRLKDGFQRATVIGNDHLTALRSEQVTGEVARADVQTRMEVVQRETHIALQDIRAMEKRCVVSVMDEVNRWHLPPRLWPSLSELEKSVAALEDRCSARIEAEIRGFTKFLDREYHVSPTNFVGVTAAIPALEMFGSRIVTEAAIREQLLDSYHRSIKQLIDNLVESVEAKIRRVRGELSATLDTIDERDRRLYEFMRETDDSLRGLHRLDASLNAGSLYLPEDFDGHVSAIFRLL